MANGHGGARDGAGRKANTYSGDQVCEELRQRIIAALPDIIDKQIELARAGNAPAAKFLIIQIFGRPGVNPLHAKGDFGNGLLAMLTGNSANGNGSDTTTFNDGAPSSPSHGSRAERRRANLKKTREIKSWPSKTGDDRLAMINALRAGGTDIQPFPL